jgi:hypothetical protein
VRGLSYHERCAAQRERQRVADLAGLHVARCAVASTLAAQPVRPHHRAWAIRHLWKHLRQAGRACDRTTTDRLEWRGRCHRINGSSELVKWPGGQATRHIVHLRERARCLLMGRDYPIAGPSGRLP